MPRRVQVDNPRQPPKEGRNSVERAILDITRKPISKLELSKN